MRILLCRTRSGRAQRDWLMHFAVKAIVHACWIPWLPNRKYNLSMLWTVLKALKRNRPRESQKDGHGRKQIWGIRSHQTAINGPKPVQKRHNRSKRTRRSHRIHSPRVRRRFSALVRFSVRNRLLTNELSRPRLMIKGLPSLP
jgi:hypothetical protein